MWHFGISSDFQLKPILAQIISPHVLFSYDGSSIWQSASKLHRARRSACKDWWNPHWRDRIFASIYWIAQKQGKIDEIHIPVAPNDYYSIPTMPIMFESSVSYTENVVETDEIDDEDIIEDDELVAIDEEN